MHSMFWLCGIYFGCSEAFAYYLITNYILNVHRYWISDLQINEVQLWLKFLSKTYLV